MSGWSNTSAVNLRGQEHSKLTSSVSSAYKHALPVLAKHIVMPHSQETLESLARSMAMKEAAPYRDLLVDLYKGQPAATPPGPGDFGMGLVAAVSAALPKGRFDELMDLIKTPACEAGPSC
jgi:hypothetical protein